MNNPRYAEVWKLLAAMEPYTLKGGSSYDACSTPSTVSPPLSPQSLLVQGKVAMLWGGSWFIPQLDSAGYSGKYGLFAEPPITTATTPYATGVDTTDEAANKAATVGLAGGITLLVVLFLAYLAGGIVVVEYVFNYPGVGAKLVDAVHNKDLPVAQTVTLLIAAVYVVVNLLADVLTLLVSPRVRTSLR